MDISSYTKGYSLVEVLVAVSILMLAIVGPITIASKSVQSAQHTRQQNTAYFLAQEGIGAVNWIRDRDALQTFVNGDPDPWSWVNRASLSPCFGASGCNIDFTDGSLLDNVTSCAGGGNPCQLLRDTAAGRVIYQLNSGDPSPYTRVIRLEQVTADEVKVESTVTWNSTLLGAQSSVTLTSAFFNMYKP